MQESTFCSPFTFLHQLEPWAFCTVSQIWPVTHSLEKMVSETELIATSQFVPHRDQAEYSIKSEGKLI
jgi:hypothetical protein